VHLIAWAGPQGGRLLATLDGQDVEGLAVDEQGRSYVELYAPQKVQQKILVVRNASPKRRTLRLAVGEETNPASGGRQCIIDAFQVISKPRERFPTVPVILLLAGCAVVGWFLVRSMSRPLSFPGNRS
jgi:hypothetical protein